MAPSRYFPVPVKKIGDLIAASANLQALARQARRLKDLEHLLFEAVPAELAAASRITNLKAGTLVISADNAAVAAKLRQLAPRLLLHVRKQEIQVTKILVDVQVRTPQNEVEHEVTKRALPADAIQEFSGLADRLASSPLKSALGRFVARRSTPKGR